MQRLLLYVCFETHTQGSNSYHFTVYINRHDIYFGLNVISSHKFPRPMCLYQYTLRTFWSFGVLFMVYKNKTTQNRKDASPFNKNVKITQKYLYTYSIYTTVYHCNPVKILQILEKNLSCVCIR